MKIQRRIFNTGMYCEGVYELRRVDGDLCWKFMRFWNNKVYKDDVNIPTLYLNRNVEIVRDGLTAFLKFEEGDLYEDTTTNN